MRRGREGWRGWAGGKAGTAAAAARPRRDGAPAAGQQRLPPRAGRTPATPRQQAGLPRCRTGLLPSRQQRRRRPGRPRRSPWRGAAAPPSPRPAASCLPAAPFPLLRPAQPLLGGPAKVEAPAAPVAGVRLRAARRAWRPAAAAGTPPVHGRVPPGPPTARAELEAFVEGLPRAARLTCGLRPPLLHLGSGLRSLEAAGGRWRALQASQWRSAAQPARAAAQPGGAEARTEGDARRSGAERGRGAGD